MHSEEHTEPPVYGQSDTPPPSISEATAQPPGRVNRGPKATISITGISGYFGQVLLPLLEADGEIAAIRGFDRRPPSNPGAEPPSGSKLEFHQVDLSADPGPSEAQTLGGDPQVEALLHGSDTLVHLAFEVMRLPGQKHIDRTNIFGMRLACEAAARQGLRKLVVTSSVVAYGMHPDNPPVLDEDAPLRPNPGLYYGQAKAANERFLDEFERLHPEITVTRLRPCTTVGPHAGPAMMASLTTDPTILIRSATPPGDYNPHIQLVHEQDVASALHLAICADLPGPSNVVGDDPRTLTELVALRRGRTVVLPYPIVRLLMALAWRTGRSVFAPEWIDLTRYPLVASNARLKAAGWRPAYTTPQAFAAVLDGARKE